MTQVRHPRGHSDGAEEFFDQSEQMGRCMRVTKRNESISIFSVLESEGAKENGQKFMGAPSDSGLRAVADWGCGDDMHHGMFIIFSN